MLGADELAALAKDIANNGQREPILIADGLILDGRNRYRACELAGVQPRCRSYKGTDPIALVVSMNIHRRHLDVSQRSMIADKLAGLKRGGQETNVGIPTFSQPAAAKLMNVSRDSVVSAHKVRTQGVPELVKAVESGAVAVSVAAEVATLPAEVQTKAVELGPEALQKAAKRVRKTNSPKPQEQPKPGGSWIIARLLIVTNGVRDAGGIEKIASRWSNSDRAALARNLAGVRATLDEWTGTLSKGQPDEDRND